MQSTHDSSPLTSDGHINKIFPRFWNAERGSSIRNALRVVCLVGLGCYVIAAQAGVAINQVERKPGNQNPARRITLTIRG